MIQTHCLTLQPECAGYYTPRERTGKDERRSADVSNNITLRGDCEQRLVTASRTRVANPAVSGVFVTRRGLPYEEIERLFPLERLEVVAIRGDDGGADGARSQSNQGIEVQVPELPRVVALGSPESSEDFARATPFTRAREEDRVVRLELVDETTLRGQKDPAPELGQDDG